MIGNCIDALRPFKMLGRHNIKLLKLGTNRMFAQRTITSDDKTGNDFLSLRACPIPTVVSAGSDISRLCGGCMTR